MLRQNEFKTLYKGEIKPTGWLLKQLQIQAEGLSGNLDKVWPDVRDSKWLGGDREGWERLPYWLDGFIPLAYLLDDKDMKKRAQFYINTIIDSQDEDGWLCPCELSERPNYDLWSGILISKVLVVYADLSGDERAIDALYRFLKCLYAFLNRNTLFNWGMMRWFELLIPIFWLYEKCKEDWLIDLAEKLKLQGFDYVEYFTPFRATKPKRVWTYETHVVNHAMALKQDGLVSRLRDSNYKVQSRRMLDTLMKYHGTCYGHFNGDECLSGISPVQGSELCGIVEAMFSYECLLAITGDPFWADALEKLAFNALPATMTDDMWAHQYDQLSNQVRSEPLPQENVVFVTNGPESHLFGLEPNYGCCTANFNQGWPKFAMNLYMQTVDSLISTILAPGKVSTEISGVRVDCELLTDFPFDNKLKYKLSVETPTEFVFCIRIPSYVDSAIINGKTVEPGVFYKIKKTWEGTSTIDVILNYEPRLVENPSGLSSVWYGPLLFSLPIKEEWNRVEYTKDGVERKYPYCDYHVLPKSDWNYAFNDNQLTVRKNSVNRIPFSQSPKASLEIEANLVKIPWKEEHGIATEKPQSIEPISDPEVKVLVPYAAAKLRMTEMPIIDQ